MSCVSEDTILKFTIFVRLLHLALFGLIHVHLVDWWKAKNFSDYLTWGGDLSQLIRKTNLPDPDKTM
jgi:hypothetical protein